MRKSPRLGWTRPLNRYKRVWMALSSWLTVRPGIHWVGSSSSGMELHTQASSVTSACLSSTWQIESGWSILGCEVMPSSMLFQPLSNVWECKIALRQTVGTHRAKCSSQSRYQSQRTTGEESTATAPPEISRPMRASVSMPGFSGLDILRFPRRVVRVSFGMCLNSNSVSPPRPAFSFATMLLYRRRRI